MNWYLKIAGMPYGSWISPEGSVYNVGITEHFYKAKDILKEKYNISFDSDQDAVNKVYVQIFRLGYIRCVWGTDSYIQFNKINSIQKRIIIRLLKEYGSQAVGITHGKDESVNKTLRENQFRLIEYL